ncbi:MAG: hypothetical protein IPM41_06575 [Sphingomonadales bacterium]|nr:hypothetical protein [Sphingomonadales bacterium]
MTQTLTVATPTLSETMQLGDLLAQSGFFADSRGAAQAVVKVLAGREIGFGPIASMTGIHVISGRVSISANLMAAAIKRSGRYDYRVREMTAQRCEIEFRERNGDKWEIIGSSEFTAQDARAAGTKNMDKYARNMLFARAMSNGARWYCPDIFGGPVYTPEEMGAQVDGETGEVIDAPAPRVVVERQPETASGAGKQPQDPPGFSVWADWSKPEHAIQWGLSQGVFDHQKHAENAYAKCKAACQPATARQMWECWYEDVQQRSHAKAAGHTITDADLDGEPDETPQFS